MENIIVTVLVIVIILLLLFLILREVMCWYFKINERITLQKETNDLLKKLGNNETTVTNTEEAVKVEQNEEGNVFCTNCGHENEPGVKYCSECLRARELWP